MYYYTVRCEFHGNDPQIIDRWLSWLRDPHIADVVAGGALDAEVVKMNSVTPTFEIRYRFPSRQAFDRYQAEFAPGLKTEGLRLFPPDALGLVYSRSDGEVIFSTNC